MADKWANTILEDEGADERLIGSVKSGLSWFELRGGLISNNANPRSFHEWWTTVVALYDMRAPPFARVLFCSIWIRQRLA